MIEIKAPNPYQPSDDPVVFLAGSIEMDKAKPWQKKLVELFTAHEVVFLNPRRDMWDAEIKQTIKDPNFNEQVNWELNGIEFCDLAVFYFDPDTVSPISLLELGIVANSRRPALVCCPDGYFRKGNIEVVCERANLEVIQTFEELCAKLNNALLTLNTPI